MAIKKKEEKQETMVIKVTRAKEFKSGDIGLDAEVNGIKLYGMSYINSDAHDNVKESFISFPSRKGSDGKYYNQYWFKITDAMTADIERQLEELI